jgi:hypothetical protein
MKNDLTAAVAHNLNCYRRLTCGPLVSSCMRLLQAQSPSMIEQKKRRRMSKSVAYGKTSDACVFCEECVPLNKMLYKLICS